MQPNCRFCRNLYPDPYPCTEDLEHLDPKPDPYMFPPKGPHKGQ